MYQEKSTSQQEFDLALFGALSLKKTWPLFKKWLETSHLYNCKE
jgi:hypothetical protein